MKTPRQKRTWYAWLLATILVLFIAGLILRHFANSDLYPVIQTSLHSGTSGKSLIVVVHGYLGSTQSMTNVFYAITNARPESDVMLVQYNGWRFSNADCFQVAEGICQEIHQRYTNRPYANIEFVGYSMGALLARKAFVYGWGRIDDLDPSRDAAPVRRAPQPWVTNVNRFVLLAGMNRGWTTRTRASGMPWYRVMAFRVGKLIGWATDTGRVILQAEAGEPFVANLRMQWLQIMRSLPRDQRPIVLQLLGDKDDIVSKEDNRDVNVSRDFIWVQLSGTGHANVTDFREKIYGPERERKFKEALGGREIIEQLRRMSPGLAEADDTNIVEAVVVLHGIRDFGEWTSQFEEALQKQFIAKHPEGGKLLVYRPTYGYFDMLSFLLWPERQKKVRWFMDELTEMQARYPNMTNLHFIGHSHGTYVLASALTKYKALKVGRAVFAGSVVRKDFNWTSPSLSGRVEKVRSYAGSRDWVVAFFPRLFELWPFTLINEDIGSAGFNGFTKPRRMPEQVWTSLTNTFLFQTKYVKGAHSTAIENDPEKISSIVAFVTDGLEKPVTSLERKRPWWIWLPSKLCFLVWAVLIGFLIWLGKKATPWLAYVLNRFGSRVTESPQFCTRLSWGIYALIVWAVLKQL